MKNNQYYEKYPQLTNDIFLSESKKIYNIIIQLNEKYEELLQDTKNKIYPMNEKGKNLRVENIKKELDFFDMYYTQIVKSSVLIKRYKNENLKFDIVATKKFDRFVSKTSDFIYPKTVELTNNYIANKNIYSNILSIGKIEDELRPKWKQILFFGCRWNVGSIMYWQDLSRNPEDMDFLKRPYLKDNLIPVVNNIIATYFNVCTTDEELRIYRLVDCFFPNAGKTYVLNVYSLLMSILGMIYESKTGLMRVTNGMDNALDYISQCLGIAEHNELVKIYPELEQYYDHINMKNRIFTNNNPSLEKVCLKDCGAAYPRTFYPFGIGAAINGKRAPYGGTLDDLSPGVDAMDNEILHKFISKKVVLEIEKRANSPRSPFIYSGTMYNNNDYLNMKIEGYTNQGIYKHPILRNTWVTRDNKCAIIIQPLEENGVNIAPLVWTEQNIQETKNDLAKIGNEYAFDLIFNQKKSSKIPRIFALSNLKTYIEKPLNLIETSISIIDPTRKSGSDFFAMPFFNYCPDDGLYYLTDTIFEQEALGELSDPKNIFRDKVCNQLIALEAYRCIIENNTSNLITTALKDRLKILYPNGDGLCIQFEEFTKAKDKISGSEKSTKMETILKYANVIKNYIVFPDISTLSFKSPMYKAISSIVSWDCNRTSGKDNPDDFPDILASFAKRVIFPNINLNRGATLPDMTIEQMKALRGVFK